MIKFNVQIINAEQVRFAFDSAPDLMRPAIKNAINRSILLIGTKAALNAPVRTGRLRSSILGGSYKGGSYPQGYGLQLATDTVFYKGSVGSGTNYGLFVEMGTRFMRAQPFLQPAINSTSDQVQRFFTNAVQSVLDKIAERTK